MPPDEPPVPERRGESTSNTTDSPIVHSRDLLRGQQEVRIEHDGQTYRLRVTRSGKLILHK